jgi:tetratricopeptide (TPR) repeat protein
MEQGLELRLEEQLRPVREALRRGRCVLCLGGELASDGSLRRLIGQLLSTLPDAPEVSGARDLLEARPLMTADVVRRRLGGAFPEALARATASSDVPELLRLLGNLPFSAVVTTSYDAAVERAFQRNGALPAVVTPRDPVVTAGRARVVYKLFGDPSRSATIVFGATDLHMALHEAPLRKRLGELFREHTCFFVGFDGADAELWLLLERFLSDVGRGSSDHYAVVSGLTQLERQELFEIYRLRVLELPDVSRVVRWLHGSMVDPRRTLPSPGDLEGWLAILADDPTRTDAIEQLEALESTLWKTGDHARLVELYVGRTAVEPLAVRRAALLTATAQVLEDELNDPERALEATLEAYREAPTRAAWEPLERLAGATRRWNDLARELSAQMHALPAADRADAWALVSAIRDEQLDDLGGAVAAADAALAIVPHHRDALVQRLGVLRRAERWDDLEETLGRCILIEESPSRRCELYVSLGDLFETHKGDPLQATACYRLAIEAEPGAAGARAALEAILLRRGEIEELITTLEQRLLRASNHEALPLRRRIAVLCEERLADRRLAIHHYETLRAMAPAELETLTALARLYQAEGRTRSLLEVLEASVAVAEAPADRATYLRRLALEWEQQPSGGRRAASAWEQLLQLQPSDEEVLLALERVYGALERHDDLVAILERHLAIAPAPARVRLLLHVAAVYETKLRDLQRAQATYQRVLELAPDQPDALDAVARMYEAQGAYDRAIAAYERRAAAADPSAKVLLFFKSAQLASERLGDSQGAEALYARALEADPNHVPSLLGLGQLYRRRGELYRFARLLTEAVAKSPNRLTRTRLLIEAGECYERLDDPRQALDLYRLALDEDPEHADAASRAAELLYRAGRVAEAVPLYDLLARREAPAEVLVNYLVRLGQGARALDDLERATKAFRRALTLVPTDPEALRGLSAVLFTRQAYPEARTALVTLLSHHEGTLDPREQVDLHHKIGLCDLKADRPDAARERFALACAIDPTHRPSRLAQLELSGRDPHVVIEAKKALLSTADRAEQIRLFLEIGDLYLDRLEDPVQSVGSWEAGLEVAPTDVRLLHRCMNVFVEQKSWTQALTVLDRLIKAEPKPQTRAKYHSTAGIICLEHLGRFADAADHLWAAVEGDPGYRRAATALENMLRDHKSWKELARYLQFAIRHLEPIATPEKRAEQIRLWALLGDVYRDRLKDPASAVVAFEVAFRLDPTGARRLRLANLYAEVGRTTDAIAQHHALLLDDKARVASYRALEALYRAAAKPAQAEACARAAAMLDSSLPLKDGPADRELPQAARPLTPALLSALRHPGEDAELTTFFAAVAPAVAAARARRERRVLERDGVLSADDPRPVVRALKRVAEALLVPLPRVRITPDQSEPVALQVDVLGVGAGTVEARAVVPVVSLARAVADQSGHGWNERELIFELARRIVLLRPEYLIRWLLPMPRELAHLIEGGIALAGEAEGRPAAGELKKTTDGYRRDLSPVALDTVASLGHAFQRRQVSPEAAALRWVHATDFSCARAALVLAGDVARAAKVLEREPPVHGVAASARVLDLIWSSTSDEVAAARAHLGLIEHGPDASAQTGSAPTAPAGEASAPPRPIATG